MRYTFFFRLHSKATNFVHESASFPGDFLNAAHRLGIEYPKATIVVSDIQEGKTLFSQNAGLTSRTLRHAGVVAKRVAAKH